MLLTRLLNACHHFPGFVYEGARLNETTRPSKSRCAPGAAPGRTVRAVVNTAPGYDTQPERRFEFIPVWGFRGGVTLPHAAGAVQRLRGQGGRGAVGHRQAHPDPRLHAVSGPLGAEVVLAGDGAKLPPLGRRSATPWSTSCSGGSSSASSGRSGHRRGRDPVWARPPVSDAGLSDRGRLHPPAVGGQGTHEASFEQFFTLIGRNWRQDRVRLLGHVEALPGVIEKHCTNALNILDRFHVVAKMNLALDEVRAAEARRMAQRRL